MDRGVNFACLESGSDRQDAPLHMASLTESSACLDYPTPKTLASVETTVEVLGFTFFFVMQTARSASFRKQAQILNKSDTEHLTA